MKYAIRMVLGALAIVAAACSGDESAGPAVATPTVTLSKSAAAIGSPVGMTYRFDVAQDAAIDGDYLVFMHVIGPDGEKLWQDDHAPAVPTSQWKPGQTVEYDRLVFVPNYPYIGQAEIRGIETNGVVFNVRWVNEKELKSGALKIYPNGITEML